MTTWYTEEEAARFLNFPTVQKLAWERYRKRIGHFKFPYGVRYSQEHLDAYMASKEYKPEKLCVDNQNSSGEKNPPSGTSKFRDTVDADRSALVRARLIVSKLNESSRNSS